MEWSPPAVIGLTPALVQPIVKLVYLVDDACEAERARERNIADVGNTCQVKRNDHGL
jgi:hypothetical protein